MKECLKCKIDKDETLFFNQNICTECIYKCEGTHICKECNIEKSLTEYYKKSTYKMGYLFKCTQCVLKNGKEKYTHIVKYTDKDIELKVFNEFMKTKIIKSDKFSDCLTLTFLYNYYTVYVSNKNYKNTFKKEEFKANVSEYLGEYVRNKWNGCKLV